MKLDTLVSSLSLSCVVGDIPSDFNGVYAGDFLSRAMSRVEADNLWIRKSRCACRKRRTCSRRQSRRGRKGDNRSFVPAFRL